MPSASDRRGLAGRRLLTAFAAGTVVLVVVLLAGGGWTVGLSLGWIAVALAVSGSLWWRIRGMDSKETAAHAKEEDYTRPLADLVVLTASAAGLVAIGFTLVQARHHSGVGKGLLIALAVAVVAFSWITVHLVYTVRYGDLYYGDPVGGIDFNEDERPDYRDFVYLALSIGMTFQVSDTNLSSKAIRRQVTRHALLSCVFATVIVALAINTVASLLQ
jgi:uncharacterized membrane protein